MRWASASRGYVSGDLYYSGFTTDCCVADVVICGMNLRDWWEQSTDETVCFMCDGFEGIVVDQSQALRFALDVARGMEFLHSMEPLIPNLTLNSKHIMVIHQWNSVCVCRLLIAEF